MKLSIVTSLYNSVPYINEFYRRIKEAINKINVDYEIFFVNDGSSDNSLDIAKNICDSDPKVTIIQLSRNFGQHKAIMTGLSHTTGDLVFMLDCDLEEDPEYLIEFYHKMKEAKDCDMVYGVQKHRKGRWFERFTGYLFYSLMNVCSYVKIPRNVSTIRLMTRKYVNSLLLYKEHVLFLYGVFSLIGYKQIPIEIDKHDKGSTTYTIKRKLLYAVDAITSFSEKPLIYLTWLGGIILFISIFYIIFLVFKKIFFHEFIGWSSLIVSIWFFGGLLLFAIGILGLYLSRVFVEVKNRPLTIISDVYKSPK